MKLFDMQAKHINWRKSSFCAGGECAQIARSHEMVLMRSTLAPRAVVRYTPEEFRALRLAFQNHEFDDLG